MTDRYVWSAPLPTPPAARLHVREALVPMLLWPSVPMVQQVEQDLTVIEQFVLEAALALEPVRAVDIEEVTGIPADAVTRIRTSCSSPRRTRPTRSRRRPSCPDTAGRG